MKQLKGLELKSKFGHGKRTKVFVEQKLPAAAGQMYTTGSSFASPT